MVGGVLVNECLSEDDDDQLEDQEGKTDQDEAEDLSASVGNNESVVDVGGALFAGSHVSEGSDLHAKISCEDGCKTSNQEGSGGVGELDSLRLNSEDEED